MSIGQEIAVHLRDGYHPRTSKHSDFQSYLIIRDLVARCPLIAQRAKSGEIVAKLRHHQQVGHADWVIDIALGTPAGVPIPPLDLDLGEPSTPIKFAPPVIIQIAIELKSILTEHGKARKNRLRDFTSFHGYAHQYDQKTVAGAFLLVNAAERFYSPLRAPSDITSHGNSRSNARQIAKNAVDIFRSIHLRNGETDAPGMEAIGIEVVEHDNLVMHPDPLVRATALPTQIAPTPPSLAVGDPLSYESMLQRICKEFTKRFS